MGEVQDMIHLPLYVLVHPLDESALFYCQHCEEGQVERTSIFLSFLA